MCSFAQRVGPIANKLAPWEAGDGWGPRRVLRRVCQGHAASLALPAGYLAPAQRQCRDGGLGDGGAMYQGIVRSGMGG